VFVISVAAFHDAAQGFVAGHEPGESVRRVLLCAGLKFLLWRLLQLGTAITRWVAVALTQGLVSNAEVFDLDLSGLRVFTSDGFIHFLTVDLDRAWGVNAQPNFVPPDVNDGDFDLVADHDRFVALS
jgi:hypothetical protein